MSMAGRETGNPVCTAPHPATSNSATQPETQPCRTAPPTFVNHGFDEPIWLDKEDDGAADAVGGAPVRQRPQGAQHDRPAQGQGRRGQRQRSGGLRGGGAAASAAVAGSSWAAPSRTAGRQASVLPHRQACPTQAPSWVGRPAGRRPHLNFSPCMAVVSTVVNTS